MTAVPKLRRKDNAVRVSVIGLFIIGLFYTCYFAAPVLVPITIAILLSILLAPAVERLERIYLPRSIAAAIIVAAALALIVGAVVTLAGPAQDWVARAPASFTKIQERLKLLKKPIQDIERATEQLQNATELSDRPPPRRQIVELRRPSFMGELLSSTQRAATSVGIVIILLFFLLTTGDVFMRKLVGLLPEPDDKARVIDMVQSVKRDISFYLLTLTLTNIGYGVLVTATAWCLGVDNALLWGAFTAVLSFAPYIGPAAIVAILSMVGVSSLASLTAALALPGIYLAVLLTVQNVISPFIWGKRLALNPVAIFVAIILWGWMWGMAGALLAVPLLASFRIVAERIEFMRPAAEFISS